MFRDRLLRMLSHLWPIKITTVASAMGQLDIRWEDGHKVLNSKHGNQSFGSLHEVWVQTFHAIEIADRKLEAILMLGLGGGSVAHILRTDLGITAPITAVEIDPVMIDLAQRTFGLNELEQITVIQGDAIVQLHMLKKRFDLILIDLFDDLDLARGVDTNGFAHGLRDRCSDGGLICFNTVSYDPLSEKRCDRILSHLKKVFNTVTEYRFEGVNRVFVAS